MAKVDRNTIQATLNEFNELEYELSTDEACRDLDEFESMDCQNYGNDLESLYFDDHGDYDWRNDCFYGDY